jgi:hypothetical protein
VTAPSIAPPTRELCAQTVEATKEPDDNSVTKDMILKIASSGIGVGMIHERQRLALRLEPRQNRRPAVPMPPSPRTSMVWQEPKSCSALGPFAGDTRTSRPCVVTVSASADSRRQRRQRPSAVPSDKGRPHLEQIGEFGIPNTQRRISVNWLNGRALAPRHRFSTTSTGTFSPN